MTVLVETWVSIRGWSSYEVSDLGRVRSVERVVLQRNGIKKLLQSVYLKTFGDKDGYHMVSLSQDERLKKFKVHTLVIEHFDRKGRPGEECRHLDGNNTNNRRVNLKWGTRLENQSDARKHGTLGPRSPAAEASRKRNLGVKRPLWWRQRISEGLKGHVVSSKTRKKISNTKRGLL